MKNKLIYLLIIVLLLTITFPLMAAFPDWIYTMKCDIKPGNYPNTINLKSNGVIPVAIFGNQYFNVELIDPSSLWLEGAQAFKWSLADSNYDGYIDLISHFKTKDTDINVGQLRAEIVFYYTSQDENGWYSCSDDICTLFE